jgi:hypothetical protein
VGSVLPSDNESVRTAPLKPSPQPRRTTVTVEEVDHQGGDPAVPSRQSSPEAVVVTVPSKWRFDEAGDVEGRVELRSPAQHATLRNRRAPSKGESRSQDTTTFRSRFFPTHVPSPAIPTPSPRHIPKTNEQPLLESTAERPIIQAEFASSIPREPHQEALYSFKPATDDPPYITYSPLFEELNSFEEHVVHGGAMDDPIHQGPGLTVAHFIEERLELDDYVDVPTDDLLGFYGNVDILLDTRNLEEPVENHDARQDSPGPVHQRDGEYCYPVDSRNVDGIVWEDATLWEDTTRWNDNIRIEGDSCGPFLSCSQNRSQAACQEQFSQNVSISAGVDQEVYHQARSVGMPAGEDPPTEEIYEDLIDHDRQDCEEEDVMLEFTEGRTLLMGMGNGILAEEPTVIRELRPEPYRLQFGQSVDEIEVMVGKSIRNLWKR